MAAILCLLVATCLHAAGGPDAFGYTWLDSGDSGGPTFDWVDITTLGTEVVGLSDDNAASPLDMGMTFRFYWADFDSVTVGSNGWISFNPVSNIASCFPTIPSPGGPADNFLAPLMTDLNFAGAGNPGRVYVYHDADQQRFIVSYHDVPFWVNAVPDWTGSNTFQVILSAADNSITFQYLDVEPTFGDNAGCPADVSVGMENITGNIGLQVSVEVMPADGSAVRFVYPDPVTFEIVDPAPLWHNDSANKGVIRAANQDLILASAIWNAGNTDASSAISVRGRVLDSLSSAVSDESLNVLSLPAQQQAPADFTPVAPQSPGEYSFETSTTSPEDINPSNNTLISEIQVVDTTQATVELGWTNASVADGTLSWQGGQGGAAVYIQPPLPAFRVDTAKVFMVDPGTSPASSFEVQILDDTGPNGSPSAVLASETIAEGAYPFGSWLEVPLSSPVNLTTGGGFYVAWIMGGTDTFLGTDSTGIESRQGWELLGGGSWSEYRQTDNTELMIRAVVTPLADALEIFSDGFESGLSDQWSATVP